MRCRGISHLFAQAASARSARPASGLPAIAALGILASVLIPSIASSQEPRRAGSGGERTPAPEGVTPQIELSIERGLNYLVKTQGDDGAWTAESGTYPVAMTALAGVALLSSGSTATRGPFSPSIRRAEGFLLGSSGENGLFATGWEERPMHGHAFTMMFLAQVLGQEESLERREEIQTALRKAVDLTIRAQSANGGWYYQPNAYQDEGTLTVTMMQGLRSCRDAGIHVPKAVIDRGVKYIEVSTNDDGSVRYRIDSSQVRAGVTCASVVALWSAGRYEDPLLKRIVGYVDRYIQPMWGTYQQHATYVQYYLAQSKFLLGGSRWQKFYRDESALLLRSQRPDGSWLTQEELRAGHGVGAVYSTSIGLIILQLPYNRLPIFQR